MSIHIQSLADVAQTLEDTLPENLQCPICASAGLTVSETGLQCTQCQANFPMLSDTNIPMLFADVDAVLHGWSARLNGFNHQSKQEIDHFKQSLKHKQNSSLTKQRIKALVNAKSQFVEQVKIVLKDFANENLDGHLLANKDLAKNQGVDSYINNIFRDWSWQNGETQALIECVDSVIPESEFNAGNLLTLGAGAARLSFDMHYRYQAKNSVLLDINPFLLGLASKIIQGDTVELYEFPTAPLNKDDFAVLQQCQLPELNHHVHEDFKYVLADTLNIPFTDKSFDTVLTPWLIDIIPADFRELIAHVNRVLKVGGFWLNTGSLAFFHQQSAWNYSVDEVLDLLQKHGFEVINSNRKAIPYLQSPYSAHGRIENVFNFAVRKKHDCIKPNKHQYLSQWLIKNHMPIPQDQQIIIASSQHLLQAQVLSAIDGKRSINEISELLVKQYNMPIDQAVAVVKQVLMDNIKSN